MLIIIDGLDEVPYESFKEVLKYINEFSQAHRNLNMLVSCRTVFFNRYSAAGTLSLFEVYEIALCKKFSITEVNDIILDAIYNKGSDSSIRGDSTEIYLEPGGDPEKIFKFFRNFTSLET